MKFKLVFLILIIILVLLLLMSGAEGIVANHDNLIIKDEEKRGLGDQVTRNKAETAKRGAPHVHSTHNRYYPSTYSGITGPATGYHYEIPSAHSYGSPSGYYGHSAGGYIGTSGGHHEIDHHHQYPIDNHHQHQHHHHQHPMDNYHHNHYGYGQKALALKGILIPLAGIALLGAAAALSTNPVLLQLGVVNGRRKRSLSNYDKVYPISPKVNFDRRN